MGVDTMSFQTVCQLALVSLALSLDEPQYSLRGSNVSTNLDQQQMNVTDENLTNQRLEAHHVLEVPDFEGDFDEPGPYDQEPSNAAAEQPLAAKQGWAANGTSNFCEMHHTGFWCDGATRVRCCEKNGTYVKFGSTFQSVVCGWESGSNNTSNPSSANMSVEAAWWYGGGGSHHGGGGYGGYHPWHLHRGWHQSSFCQSHHVGSFCYHHTRTHCCNDYGHYV